MRKLPCLLSSHTNKFSSHDSAYVMFAGYKGKNGWLYLEREHNKEEKVVVRCHLKQALNSMINKVHQFLNPKYEIFNTYFFILIAFFIQHSVVGQSYFKKDYPDVWQRAAGYTLEVAEAMPAYKYGFKPMGERMSFQEQMVHLVLNLSYLSGQVTGERIDFLKGKKPEALTKEEVILVLGQALNHVGQLIKKVDEQTLGEIIPFGGEEMPKENIFYLMRDHTTHHRGQAILYLRLNGVKAPKYVGW